MELLRFTKYETKNNVVYKSHVKETISPTYNITYDFDFNIVEKNGYYDSFIDIKATGIDTKTRVIGNCKTLFEAQFMCNAHYSVLMNLIIGGYDKIFSEYEEYKKIVGTDTTTSTDIQDLKSDKDGINFVSNFLQEMQNKQGLI